MGTLFFVLLTVKPVYTYLSARSWVETPCKILASRVETRAGKATCYVNPKNPEASVIDRSASLRMLWGLFPFPFMLIGYWGLFSMIFGKSRGTSEPNQQDAQT